MAQTQSTKERILACAVKAIDKGGEESVRIRQICAQTKTTAPSLYYFFGSREGLVEAAQAVRFTQGQSAIAVEFAKAVYRCNSKSDFTAVAHRFIDQTFSPKRRSVRAVRTNVLGSAQSRKSLAKVIAKSQSIANQLASEPIKFAQEKGWVRRDFNPEMFLAWIIGVANAQTMIELDGLHPDHEDWVLIATRAICLAIGIDEPNSRKPTRKNKKH